MLGRGEGVSSKEAAALGDMAQSVVSYLDAVLASLAAGGQTDAYVGDVASAEQRIRHSFGCSADVVVRTLRIPALGYRHVLVAVVAGLVGDQLLADAVIGPVLRTVADPSTWDKTVFGVADVHRGGLWSTVLAGMATGRAAVVVEGLPYCWLPNVQAYQQRAIPRPRTEISVRGPDDAFNEVLSTQIALIRQRLADPALHFVEITVGTLQRTRVAVAYLEGVTHTEWVEMAVARIRALNISGRVNATQLAGRIRDYPLSIFPTIRASERVDMAVWWLLEGKVLILVDGDPFVLSVPAPLPEFYRTGADYSSSWADAGFSRCIRFAGWAVGVYLPALYIALTEVNPGLIPPALLMVIIGNHLGLPFPPITEALLMIGIIEILREAALRLPKAVSSTIGTVGAIVVGTAVVKAGVVSPQIIVVMTLTALAFFSAPVYELSSTWRAVGLVMLLAAAVLGLFGIIVVTVVLVGALIGLQSFGVPYLDGLAPANAWKVATTLMRPPWALWSARAVRRHTRASSPDAKPPTTLPSAPRT
jgi:spore germination protein KA